MCRLLLLDLECLVRRLLLLDLEFLVHRLHLQALVLRARASTALCFPLAMSRHPLHPGVIAYLKKSPFSSTESASPQH